MYGFKGMDPEAAKVAMAKIQEKKENLGNESRNAASVINERITEAFAGAQTEAMQGFVTRIDEALQRLYNYLDGADSNFAQKFREVIESYEVSDENVSSSYRNSGV